MPTQKRQLGGSLRPPFADGLPLMVLVLSEYRPDEHRIAHFQPRHRNWVGPGVRGVVLVGPTPDSEHTRRIFATPSVILRSSGSVGLSLVMWLLGAAVALCGTAVYMELGTVRPASLFQPSSRCTSD